MSLKNRIETAFEIAKNGNVILIEGIKIMIDSNDQLIIMGFSKTPDIKFISKESALKEIEIIRNTYSFWLSLTDKFKELKNWLQPIFILSFIAAKNGIGICKVSEDHVEWLIDF